jgi:Q family heterogeneous nuclear ribonucleoprotein R
MEDELVPIFERCGTIYELRHMMDFAGTNRGFAYVRYACPEEANRAIQQLNNYEIRKNHYIGVMLSVDNCRLFVGGIPRTKTKEEVKSEMTKITEGVVDVILKPSAHDKTKNRGFAFVEYEHHRAAAMARRKLVPGKMQLWGQMIAVDWAEPEQEVDNETMSKVRIIYLSNLMLRTSEDKIRDIILKIRPDSVERVKKIKDYAFVHFYHREDADEVLNYIDGMDIDGSCIRAEWAKPPDKSLLRYVKNVQKASGSALFGLGATGGSVHQNIVAAATQLYSATGNPSDLGVVGGAENAGGLFTYGGNSVNAGVQPKRAAGGGRGAAGWRGAGVRQAMANAVKSASANAKFTTMLDLQCIQAQWGLPSYQLQTTITPGAAGTSTQLYTYRVTIPALAPAIGSFQGPRPAATMDEAKELAAQTAVQSLGIMIYPTGDSPASTMSSLLDPVGASPSPPTLSNDTPSPPLDPAPPGFIRQNYRGSSEFCTISTGDNQTFNSNSNSNYRDNNNNSNNSSTGVHSSQDAYMLPSSINEQRSGSGGYFLTGRGLDIRAKCVGSNVERGGKGSGVVTELSSRKGSASRTIRHSAPSSAAIKAKASADLTTLPLSLTPATSGVPPGALMHFSRGNVKHEPGAHGSSWVTAPNDDCMPFPVGRFPPCGGNFCDRANAIIPTPFPATGLGAAALASPTNLYSPPPVTTGGAEGFNAAAAALGCLPSLPSPLFPQNGVSSAQPTGGPQLFSPATAGYPPMTGVQQPGTTPSLPGSATLNPAAGVAAAPGLLPLSSCPPVSGNFGSVPGGQQPTAFYYPTYFAFVPPRAMDPIGSGQAMLESSAAGPGGSVTTTPPSIAMSATATCMIAAGPGSVDANGVTAVTTSGVIVSPPPAGNAACSTGTLLPDGAVPPPPLQSLPGACVRAAGYC